jgi:hypothetical protein
MFEGCDEAVVYIKAKEATARTESKAFRIRISGTGSLCIMGKRGYSGYSKTISVKVSI